jgi:hypothetical protein
MADAGNRVNAPVRRLVAVATCALVALTLVAAACSGNDDVSAGNSTPGFNGSSTTTTKPTPFELANPTTTAGPTTIPGAPPTLPLPDVFRTTTTQAPAASPAPGATAPPVASLLPVTDPGIADPMCQSFYLMANAGREVQIRFSNDPNSSFASARDRLVQGFNEAINALTPRVTQGPDVPAAQTLLGRLQTMRTLAQAAVTIEQGGKIFYPLRQAAQPGEPAGWNEILSHLNRYCPSVPNTFGVAV